MSFLLGLENNKARIREQHQTEHMSVIVFAVIGQHSEIRFVCFFSRTRFLEIGSSHFPFVPLSLVLSLSLAPVLFFLFISLILSALWFSLFDSLSIE